MGNLSPMISYSKIRDRASKRPHRQSCILGFWSQREVQRGEKGFSLQSKQTGRNFKNLCLKSRSSQLCSFKGRAINGMLRCLKWVSIFASNARSPLASFVIWMSAETGRKMMIIKITLNLGAIAVALKLPIVFQLRTPIVINVLTIGSWRSCAYFDVSLRYQKE